MRNPFRPAVLGILSVAGCCLAGTPLFATTISYPDFSNTAGLQINGNAATTVTGDGTVLRLTPAVVGQAGSAFSTNQITLGAGNTFSTFFQFRFTDPGPASFGSPADGIVFVLQTAANNVGGGGGGMGYFGIPGKSLGVEFDTYNNGAPEDPSNNPNHVAVDAQGVVDNGTSLGLASVSPGGQTDCGDVTTVGGKANCMANGDLWSVWIYYDSTNLHVAIADGSTVQPADLLNFAIDLPTILGQNTAFVGFTAGTGSGFLNQDIINWQLNDSSRPITGPVGPDATVPEPASFLLLGAGLAVVAMRARAGRRS